MNIDLHARYEQQPEGSWTAVIEDHPYIFVDYAEDLDSAKELLLIHTAEELFEKYKTGNGRYRWAITKESTYFNVFTK
jgi:hypothetical protein